MPNHIINEVILHADPAKIEPICVKTINKNNNIDFGILVPLPVNHWPGSVGLTHKEAFPGIHLDDATKMWGTKWNAYGQDETGYYKYVIEPSGKIIFTFQTAWSPPRGWIVAIFNTFQIDITHHWLDEGCSDAITEKYNFKALGEMFAKPNAWEMSAATESIRKHLHKLLWGK